MHTELIHWVQIILTMVYHTLNKIVVEVGQIIGQSWSQLVDIYLFVGNYATIPIKWIYEYNAMRKWSNFMWVGVTQLGATIVTLDVPIFAIPLVVSPPPK